MMGEDGRRPIYTISSEPALPGQYTSSDPDWDRSRCENSRKHVG